MNLTRFAIRHRVFVLSLMAVLFLAGVARFLTMSRREDPQIQIRTALVTTRWPGAPAEKVEQLVTDPIEASVKGLDGVEEIRSESRSGQSILYVDLADRTPGSEVAQLWDELRVKVSAAERELPDGCGKPRVDADFGDVYDVVLALYQEAPEGEDEPLRPYSHRQLEVMAEAVQDQLEGLSQVGRVDLFGVQEERIHLEVDAADWAQLGLTTEDLKFLLDSRNIVESGGQVDTGLTRYDVVPSGEFSTLDQIEDVFVGFVDDELPVRLGELPIRVERTTVDPPSPYVLHASPGGFADRALLVGVSLKAGENIVEMGEAVDEVLSRMRATVLPPDLRLARVNDLPVQVDQLVQDFVTNLWQAVVLVLAVALVMMGWRPAIVMAAAIPLCMIASILVVSWMGVELEQFSIASLIIALGMLVDNAIVVSDNTLREMSSGPRHDAEAREGAVIRGAGSLALPILTSTLTTVFAFLPMLGIEGNTGEYVRSLPVVVSVTLITSYLVAMTVTPILCLALLRPVAARDGASRGFWGRLGQLLRRLRRRRPVPEATGEPAPRRSLYDRAIAWCLSHKGPTLLAATALVGASLLLVPAIGSEFFPGGVRDQLWIHVWLPEGSSIDATGARAREVMEIVRASGRDEEGRERLRSCTAFVGSGGPRLNLVSSPEQRLTNYALVLVRTTDAEQTAAWADELRERTADLPGARIDVRPFKLGPYVPHPVEFRVLGPDPDVLRRTAESVVDLLRDTEGAIDPFHDWSNESMVAEVLIDTERANLARVTNSSVARTLDALISGEQLTTFREGDHEIPVLLRMQPDQRARLLEHLGDIAVDGQGSKVPLESIADVVSAWAPSCIHRRDTTRAITIGCQVAPGRLPNAVAAAARPRVQELVDALPSTYRLEDGGELEQTRESQAKILGAFQISGLLILLVLVAQYNSLRKPLVVLSAIPLALVGALLGLYSTGWALGFMPSLGIVSLAGVVINNAIILIDFIEAGRREGKGLDEAAAEAGRMRMKPILLTTATTVGGLLPLALLAGPMWAGMAWAMIFGLALSTVLTLLVVPTLYAGLLKERSDSRAPATSR